MKNDEIPFSRPIFVSFKPDHVYRSPPPHIPSTYPQSPIPIISKFIFLISRVCITFFRNENKHRRFSQAFHDSSRRRGSEERGENELERQRRRATTSRATHRARAFSPENPCSVSLFFKDAGTNPGRRSW